MDTFIIVSKWSPVKERSVLRQQTTDLPYVFVDQVGCFANRVLYNCSSVRCGIAPLTPRVDGVEVLLVETVGDDAKSFAVAYKVEKVIAFSRQLASNVPDSEPIVMV